MARGRPWYKRDPERWIMGTRGLTLEERGAYSEIVDYLNLRDHPIPDDIKIVASLLGCTPHKWRTIRQSLVRHGKLVVQGDYLTNPRFEREKAERDLARAEAKEHGREGGRRSAELRGSGQPELFDDPPVRARAQGEAEIEKKSQKGGEKNREKEFVSKKSVTPVSQISADEGQGYPQPPVRGRERVREQEIDSPLTSSPTTSREKPDRMALLKSVCDAAGFYPTSPAAIERSLRQVEAWMNEGVDFNDVVFPTIHNLILSDPQPTRTLGRFTKHIAHEHARRKAKTAKGEAYRPPKVPVLSRPDEPDRMADLRQMLCQVMGANAYAIWFNDLRLEPDSDMPHRLNIHGRMSTPLMQSNTAPTVTAVAKRMGYTFLCPC